MDDRGGDDGVLLALVAAFAVVFILFLHDTANVPVRAARAHHHHARYAQCGTPVAQFDGDPITYDDVYEAEHELCNTNYFPYCHALPLVWNRQLDETYFDEWPDLGCERDLVPDAGCVEEMPMAEWHRAGYTYIENDKGCIAP